MLYAITPGLTATFLVLNAIVLKRLRTVCVLSKFQENQSDFLNLFIAAYINVRCDTIAQNVYTAAIFYVVKNLFINYRALLYGKDLNMKKKCINQIADFFGMITDNYAFTGPLAESIVDYAEQAVRIKYEDDDYADYKAGLLMAAVINYAFIFSCSEPGKSFKSYVKRERLTAEDLERLIINMAIKLAEAEFKQKPQEDRKFYMNALETTVRVYISKKDSKEEEEEEK